MTYEYLVEGGPDLVNIYMEDDGEKYIHILSYVYPGYDDEEYPYRVLEYSGFSLPLKEFMSSDFDYDIYAEGLNQYVYDYTEEEIEKYFKGYENYEPMSYNDIPPNIPCRTYLMYKPEWLKRG